jgi:hypothetical protein
MRLMSSYGQNDDRSRAAPTPGTGARGTHDRWALAARPPLTQERVAAIRQRILTGAYDAAGVVEQVARCILGSGDLTGPAGE